MKAGLRFTTILLAAGLMLSPAVALAQNTTEPVTNNSAADAIGPSELQNFSLPGTRTQPAQQEPAAPAANSAAPAVRTEQPSGTPRQSAQSEAIRRPSDSAPPRTAPPPARPDVALVSSPEQAADATAPAPHAAPSAAIAAADPPPAQSTLTPGPQRKFSFLPWLIAAIVLAGGTIFLLWRRRPREALASGPQFDLLVPSDPAPPPPARPQAAPRAAAPPPVVPPAPEPPAPVAKAPSGIVSSRLRPRIEIGVQPLRCIVDDDQVVIEFELELFNAGAAPARAVLAEASLFNPGPTQEQDLGTFFANPVGAGKGIDAIPPLKRIALTSRVAAPRGAIQEFELAGRKAFVPVIAFNALYEWSGGKGQTSAAYLVGRDTGREKLGPLRIDQGARETGRLGARPLPSAFRR